MPVRQSAEGADHCYICGSWLGARVRFAFRVPEELRGDEPAEAFGTSGVVSVCEGCRKKAKLVGLIPYGVFYRDYGKSLNEALRRWENGEQKEKSLEELVEEIVRKSRFDQ